MNSNKIKGVSRRKCSVISCDSWKDDQRRLFQYPKGTYTYICDIHLPPELTKNRKLNADCYKKLESILSNEKIKFNWTKRPIKGQRKCILSECVNSKEKNLNARFYNFPKRGSELYNTWVNNCSLLPSEESKSSKLLCDRHFDSQDTVRKYLLKSSIPLYSLRPVIPTKTALYRLRYGPIPTKRVTKVSVLNIEMNCNDKTLKTRHGTIDNCATTSSEHVLNIADDKTTFTENQFDVTPDKNDDVVPAGCSNIIDKSKMVSRELCCDKKKMVKCWLRYDILSWLF